MLKTLMLLCDKRIDCSLEAKSCFLVRHKVGNVTSGSYLYFNLKDRDKCTSVVKLIPLVTSSNLFLLKVVQKCQNCQLCVLWENSSEESIIYCVDVDYVLDSVYVKAAEACTNSNSDVNEL